MAETTRGLTEVEEAPVEVDFSSLEARNQALFSVGKFGPVDLCRGVKVTLDRASGNGYEKCRCDAVHRICSNGKV